jgi:hypothetical protein
MSKVLRSEVEGTVIRGFIPIKKPGCGSARMVVHREFGPKPYRFSYARTRVRAKGTAPQRSKVPPTRPFDFSWVPVIFVEETENALTKAIRRTFGEDIPIQRCQVHKARNITDRLDPKLHAAVRRALRQAWELNDADKAERCSAIWRGGWNSRPPVSRRASSRGWMKSSP